MFKNIMASMGFGSAKVRLELPGSDLRQGETAAGTIVVEGGKVQQKAEQAYLHLDVISQYEHSDKMQIFEDTVYTYTDNNSFDITGENFYLEIPFSFKVPLSIPLSMGRTRYYLKAGLDIKNAINPTDQAAVQIIPCREVEAVLTALEHLGFEHKRDSGDYNGRIQCFEYKPTEFMSGKLDEIEVSFKISSANLTVIMELDRKGSGLSGYLMEAFNVDEKQASLMLTRESLLAGDRPDVAAARKAIVDFLNSLGCSS